MEENSSIRYQELLAEFTARKLPEFYNKYGKDAPIDKYVSESEQHKDGELFPKVLPIEKFLDVPAPIRKRRFFEDISVGDIVEGKVNDKWADTLFIKLDSVYFGPNRWIRDLNIKAECNLSEFKTHSGSRRLSDSITDFDIGDHVRGVVSSVDHKSWTLIISFRRSSLPDHLSHTELGALDAPRNVNLDDDDDGKTYLEHLKSLPSFSNPEMTNNLLLHLGIDTKRPCTFIESLGNEVHPDEFGEKLRERQSTKWSMEMVASGVKLFKENKNDEALRCFDQALQMHPSNVEALVARGALRANQGMLKTAITDFHQALEVHPSHRNGRKYLCETLVSLAKQHEQDRNWKEALHRYKEVLEIDNDHEDARDRVHQIRMMLSQQVLAGKRHPPIEPAAKRVDIAAPVRTENRSDSLLDLLKKKMPKKSKKSKKLKKMKWKKKGKKKSKKRRSRSSSESSNSSRTDSEVTASASEKPSSDSEDEWVEKEVATGDGGGSWELTRKDERKRKHSSDSSFSKGSDRSHKNLARRSDHKDRRFSAEGINTGKEPKDLGNMDVRRSHESIPDTSFPSQERRSRESSTSSLPDVASKSRKHFSTEEISFINTLLSKKPMT